MLFGKKYVICILGGQEKEYYKTMGMIKKFSSKEAAEKVAKTISKSTVVVEYKK